MTIASRFPPIAQENTALVIIDMQKDFLDEGGACFVPGARSVVPAISSLLERFRVAELPVIHVGTVWQKDGADMSRFTTSDVLMVRGLRRRSTSSRRSHTNTSCARFDTARSMAPSSSHSSAHLAPCTL
jgi:nicotinamidase-related amidase